MCPRLQNCPEVSVHDRVEIAPHYDLWMQGNRYGIVISIFAGNAKVRMDKTLPCLARFPVSDLRRIN
jgi:hypothetical protein